MFFSLYMVATVLWRRSFSSWGRLGVVLVGGNSCVLSGVYALSHVPHSHTCSAAAVFSVFLWSMFSCLSLPGLISVGQSLDSLSVPFENCIL